VWLWRANAMLPVAVKLPVAAKLWKLPRRPKIQVAIEI